MSPFLHSRVYMGTSPLRYGTPQPPSTIYRSLPTADRQGTCGHLAQERGKIRDKGHSSEYHPELTMIQSSAS